MLFDEGTAGIIIIYYYYFIIITIVITITDRVLLINNLRIPIHSLILSLRSTVFKKLILTNIYKYEIQINDGNSIYYHYHHHYY